MSHATDAKTGQDGDVDSCLDLSNLLLHPPMLPLCHHIVCLVFEVMTRCTVQSAFLRRVSAARRSTSSLCLSLPGMESGM